MHLVEKIRLKLNLSQSAFATLLGVSQSSICSYETLSRSMSKKKAEHFAKVILALSVKGFRKIKPADFY